MAQSIYKRYFKYIFFGHINSTSKFYESYAPELAERLRGLTSSKKGLLILGEKGVGKTSALAIVAKYYLQKKAERLIDVIGDKEFQLAVEKYGGSNGSFVSPVILIFKKEKKEGVVHPHVLLPMSMISLEYLTHNQFITRLRNNPSHEDWWDCELLLLDDIGRGQDDNSGWNISLQEEFFDYRWKRKLPTFITSNITPSAFRSWPGWGRIVRRLADEDWMITIVIKSDKSMGGK
jgi:DNA replication protein DnaC